MNTEKNYFYILNYSMYRYFIQLAYFGSNYFGWQIQKNQISIQEVVNKAFSTLLNKEIDITGCGRTDTGVHAKDYYAHFDYEEFLSPEQLKNLVFKLNSFLPKDIAIKKIFSVKENAHARFDAVSRTYKYFISREKNPFFQESSWYVFGNIDVDKLNEAAAILLEYTDFSSFSKTHTQVKTNNCKIIEAYWSFDENNLLVFTITADRFLRNMVRAIVGTLVDIGLGKIPIEQLHEIIKSKNRSKAGTSVPAKALFLFKVEYDENILI